MPIEAPAGTLEVENAKFRASSVEATIAVGIGTESNDAYPLQIFKETAPDIRLSEGSTISSAARFYSNNSNLYIQTGTDFTSGSTGDVAFQTMGGQSTHMVIKSDGKVGVGTTDPGALLELSKATGSATISPTELRLSTRTNAADWSVTDPWARLAFYTNDITGGAPGVMASVGAVASSVNGGENTRLAFFTAEPHVERMCVDRYGNVGIGTTSPEYPLDVKKSAGDIEIRLEPGSNAQGNESGIRFDATFEGTIDNGHRRAADLRVGYNGGAWGKEYMSFHVGRGGQNDVAALTTERMRIAGDGNVGIGTVSPGAKLDVNGGIRTRLPHLWARQTVQPSGTTSLLLVWNTTIYNDSTLGNMYSTTRTCNFPIKGVYVVTVQAHSYIGGGATYYTYLDWVQKSSGGGTRWTTYNNPRNLSQNSGNSDMQTTGTMVIVANAGDYLEVTHGTSITTSRNYNGGWNNIRAVCIYAIN
jgi:hypothetical protein